MPIPEPPQSTLPPRPAIVRPAVVTYRASRPVMPMWYARPTTGGSSRMVPLPMRPALLPVPAPIRHAAPANC